MTKHVIQRPKYKQTPDGYTDVTIFVAKDGTAFDTEDKAIKHEASLTSLFEFRKKYDHRKISLNDNDYDVINISEDPTKEIRLEIGRRYKHISISELKKGVNLISTDDSGDYTIQNLYSLGKLIDQKRIEISRLEEDLKMLTTL